MTTAEIKDLQPGDKVRPRCDGPIMVVGAVTPSHIHTFWFTRNDTLKEGRFPRATLDLVLGPVLTR